MRVRSDVECKIRLIVEVEERVRRDRDLDERIDLPVDREADRERASGKVQVDRSEDRPLRGGVFEAWPAGEVEDVRLHEEQQPRPGKLEDEHALEVDDHSALERPENATDAERPVIAQRPPAVR